MSELTLEGNPEMKQFNVVFGGAISGGHKVEQVKKNLAALFKSDPTKIDQLFEAPQVVLKRNVDYDQAMKYHTALQRAGAMCDVQEVIQDIDQQAAAPLAPPPLPQQSGAHMIGGRKQAVHKPNLQKQTSKKSNRGPLLIVLGVIMILIRVVRIVLFGNPGFMDLLMGGLGVSWLITGIRRVTKKS